MQRFVLRLVARNFVLGPLDFLLTASHPGPCALQLGHEFRHFQHSQYLASLYPVAYIDIDLANVTRDLGVDFDLLVGKKFPCH